MSDTTALTIPQPMQLAVMFKAEKGLDPLLADIEAKALAMVKDLDPAVRKDRDLMKSAAYKVSQSKAEIDRLGKALTETQRKEIDAVNAGRSVADKFLTALRDRVKKAAEDWEAAEYLRVSTIKASIADLRNHGMAVDDASDDIRAKAEELKAITAAEDQYAEYVIDAVAAIETAIGELRIMYSSAKRREDDAVELDRLRAEAEARAEADRVKAEQEEIARVEREAAIAAELEAKAKSDREAAALLRQDEEKQEAARVAAENEKQLAAQREAELIRAQQDADARHADELAAAKQREADAAQAERDRIAMEWKVEADARAKREADSEHRHNIKTAIENALRTMAGNATPEAIADALMAGKIPHCEVKL